MKPTIKKITSVEEAQEEDQCIFYLSYNEDLTQVSLGMTTKRPISPEEYLEALSDFINNASEFPDNLFVEDVDNEHMH